MENTWDKLFDQAMEAIHGEVGDHEMLDFHAEVNETDNGKVYVWRAEGKIL